MFLGRDGSERIASVWNNDKQSDKIRILREYLGKKRSDTLDSITINSNFLRIESFSKLYSITNILVIRITSDIRYTIKLVSILHRAR